MSQAQGSRHIACVVRQEIEITQNWELLKCGRHAELACYFRIRVPPIANCGGNDEHFRLRVRLLSWRINSSSISPFAVRQQSALGARKR